MADYWESGYENRSIHLSYLKLKVMEWCKELAKRVTLILKVGVIGTAVQQKATARSQPTV